MLTRSRPLARSLRDLYSDGAEYIPLAVSQTARVFVTTPISVRTEDVKGRRRRAQSKTFQSGVVAILNNIRIGIRYAN